MLSISLCVSITTALVLTNSYSQTEPHDRAVLSHVVSIIITAATLSLVHRYYPSLLANSRDKGRYDAIPLDEFGRDVASQQKEQIRTKKNNLRPRRHVILIFVAVIVLAVRIELYRRISETAQCAGRSWEVALPLFLAINECRYQQRFGLQGSKDLNSSTGTGLRAVIQSYILQPSWRYVPSAVLLSYGCYSVTALWQGNRSTFICPIASGEAKIIPKLQQLATAFDCMLAIVVQEIARSNNSSYHRLLAAPHSYALILTGAALCWIAYAVVLFLVKQDAMQWFLVNDTPSKYWPIWLMLGQGLLSSAFAISCTYCISCYGVYQMSMVLTAVITAFLGAVTLWSYKGTFPATASTATISPFLIIYLGIWSSYLIGRATNQFQQSRTLIWQITSFALLLVLILPGLWVTNTLQVHPIEILMFNAKTQHELYGKLAGQSTDLRTAVAIYHERYQSAPPPGFDKWYEYARNRSVLIMDEYDQVHRDLFPFRAINPADLRKRTWEEVSNPWNEIAGISIRNGKAEMAGIVLPTHRWMHEGVAALINAFAQYLPDMDLAFNLNDESRVAVPYDEIAHLRQKAAQKRLAGKSHWSADRASTWQPITEEPHEETIFENFSFQKNFRRFGSIGCSPESLAITHPYLSSQSHLCLRCFEPHSIGQFVSNWTLAADMCHQPDMSQLHGFFMSPAAYKTSHQLMPVFSQSKASGYNDILYPSAWNYMDKVIYQPTTESGEYGTDNYSPGYPDPLFAKKSNTLYWRGATSEGVSAGSHTWRGMTRQRLVHLANNSTSNADHDRITILLPNPSRPDELVYYPFVGSALTTFGLQQTTNIKITDHIARCGGVDCPDQEREFGTVHPVDFQSHWKYKFLFDMDGAAFSGRFLPFLQSRSLPFKTALFREWYDSRITAWRHFIPIDMRLHGVWSTLAYFAGIDGVWPGTEERYKWEAHTAQAETIAEEGRIWAGKVLRKEDMEVYFFRLLLEWGRLTDDNRDELGFAMP